MKVLFRILFFLFSIIISAEAQNNFEVNFGTSSMDIGFSINQTFDGKYIITGSTESIVNGDDDLYLALFDTNGTLLWSKIYGGSDNDAGFCVRQTSDSGFIIAGIANISLIKTDSAGDTLWTKSYSMGAWTGGFGIVPNPDSTYIIYGDFANNITGPGDYDLYWMKIDFLGNIVSTQTYEDSSSHDYAKAICSAFDVYVIKAEGKSPVFPCQPVISTQPSDTTIFESYDAAFVLEALQQATTYQWQNDSTGVFMDIQNSGYYSGTNSDMLYISGAVISMDGYHYRCIIQSLTNCYDTSNVVTLNVNSSIGIVIQEITKNNIYPNPVSSLLKVSGKTPDKFILYDVYGKSIAEFKSGQYIDVSFLMKGIYYVQLFYSDKSETIFYKFLKN